MNDNLILLYSSFHYHLIVVLYDHNGFTIYFVCACAGNEKKMNKGIYSIMQY